MLARYCQIDITAVAPSPTAVATRLPEPKRTSPAVLFVDIGLPHMDGYELVRRLRATPETARSLIVALTGYEQLQDKERALQAGCDYHLVKPVNYDQFVELLAKVV